jgi:hypothetical protein
MDSERQANVVKYGGIIPARVWEAPSMAELPNRRR